MIIETGHSILGTIQICKLGFLKKFIYFSLALVFWMPNILLLNAPTLDTCQRVSQTGIKENDTNTLNTYLRF